MIGYCYVLFLTVPGFYLHVDLVDDLVGQGVLLDDQHRDDDEDGGDDRDQPEDALLGEGALGDFVGLVEADDRKHDAGDDSSEGHAGLEEDAREGIDDAGDAPSAGVLGI